MFIISNMKVRSLEQETKKPIRRWIVIGAVAFVLTVATGAAPMRGPAETTYGNVCGRLGSGLCYVQELHAGIPFSYLVDNPSVSVPGGFDFFEFTLWTFVLDVVFFAIVIAATLGIVRRSRHTYINIRERQGTLKTTGALLLLVLSAGGVVYVWQLKPALEACGWLDILLGRSGCIQVFPPHSSVPTSGFTDVAISKNSGVLVSGSSSSSWDYPDVDWHKYRSGVRVWQLSETWGDHLFNVEWTSEALNSVAISPDGLTVATGSQHGSVLLLELPRGTLLGSSAHHPDPIMDVAFSPDGSKVASLSRNEVRIWNVFEEEYVHLLERSDLDHPSELAFSPDGTLLSDGVQVWKVSDGTLIRTLRNEKGRQTVAFSPDGTILAVDGDDTEVELYRVSDGSLTDTFGDRVVWTKDLAYSPDGRFLVSTPVGRRSLHVWRVSDGTLLKTVDMPYRAESFEFMSNGDLVLGVADGRVLMWDLGLDDASVSTVET